MANLAVRLNDFSSGHGCFPPQVATSACSKVFIEGKLAVRIGDSWSPHTCGSNTHDAVSSVGSMKVMIEGKGVVRANDPLSCGSMAQSGATKVYIG
ncbi:PAAR domain-containing protein [Piscirickettsia litoralis]|uniref:PaaR repeat-containing protein n=1 Tax=Piscirickettsia litoralis TaxID=1891921 RepID=A0ABX3A0D9_9GAMM|nr:PAAR domain-containing protein [Piscirickettsia litoralis]ODN41166.1 hypothetical protein BGC07_17995 [Piscirickettsia litoralis]